MEKKSKVVSMQPPHAKVQEIPFGKPARIGNFKVWRTKKELGKGKDKVEVEQINISTLDESWQIKIPATFEMFGLIRSLFAEHTNSFTDKRTGQLATIFGNFLYASCIPNGYFQRAINICATIYSNPTLLKEEDENHENLMKDVQGLIAGFLEWRKEHDKQMAENEPTEADMKSDQVAEEMLEELNKE